MSVGKFAALKGIKDIFTKYAPYLGYVRQGVSNSVPIPPPSGSSSDSCDDNTYSYAVAGKGRLPKGTSIPPFLKLKNKDGYE